MDVAPVPGGRAGCMGEGLITLPRAHPVGQSPPGPFPSPGAQEWLLPAGQKQVARA